MSNVDTEKNITEGPPGRNITEGPPGKQALNGEDVFALTGTTFAGTTQMTETGPGGDGPWVQPEDDHPHAKLLVEAEMRAEHQAQARATMLDLAQALAESNKERQELADKLRHEYETSSSLRKKCDRLQKELDRIEEEEEKKKAEEMVQKALKSGNGLFFNMMLEKSKDVYDFGVFDAPDRPKTSPRPDPNSSTTQEGSSQQPDSSPPAPQQVEAKRGSVASVQPTPTDITDIFQNAVGDKVTFRWVIKLWWQEVLRTRERLEQERLERERLAKLAADRQAIEDAKRAAMEKVAKMVEDLKQRLENSQKQIEENEKRMKEMEKELQAARDKNAQDAAEAKAREDALKEENARLEAEKEKTKKDLLDMIAQYEAAQEALNRAAADFAAERNQLNGIIRNINSELQEALVMAKHMREVAMRAKREAANSVSPEKFAELCAHLEGMKNKLGQLMKDFNLEKENGAYLLRSLDKNKRQLELERQFLPLLRKVRGPVGPKAKGGQDESQLNPKKKELPQNGQLVPQNGMPPIGASPKQMRATQSLGALGATGGGGPLAGGRQTAGFQEGFGGTATTLR